MENHSRVGWQLLCQSIVQERSEQSHPYQPPELSSGETSSPLTFTAEGGKPSPPSKSTVMSDCHQPSSHILGSHLCPLTKDHPMWAC